MTRKPDSAVFKSMVSAVDLFASLAAGLLMLGLAAGSGPGAALDQTNSEVASLSVAFDDTRKELSSAKAAVNSWKQTKDLVQQSRQLVSKLALAITAREEALRTLEAQVTEKQLLNERARKLQEKLDKANKEINEMNKRRKEYEDSHGPAVQLFGTYKGRYILVECKDKSVVVHPAGREISADAPDSDIKWLLKEADSAGFVAVVARPSSFEKTCDKFVEIICNHIDEAGKNGKKIGFSMLPIDANEPIGSCIPKGVGK